MTTHTLTATYSPDDNKLRLYAATRLDAELYARVRAAGFIWAPKQDLFVAPAWTPEREDLLLELCGQIDDEDTSLVDRAEERADRFGDYSDARLHDAEQARRAVSAIADNIPFGQPILVGHHSERHARKDAERIDSGMRRTVRMWDTAQYWQRRAAGAIAHAKHKERPDVRARRIKKLEAEQRVCERRKAQADKLIHAYTVEEVARQGLVPSLLATYDGGLTYDQMRAFEKGELPFEHALPIALQNHRRVTSINQRWIDHLSNRIAYERAMLEEAGGTAADKTRPEKGGACQCWASPRGGWSLIQKVNKVSVTVLDKWSATGKPFSRTIPFDKLAQLMSAEEVQIARDTGQFIQSDVDAIGFYLSSASAAELAAPSPEPARRAKWLAGKNGCSDTGISGFRKEPAQAIDQMRASLKAGVQVVSVNQLFPTPPDLARRMVQLADLKPGMRVLEPSAGTGKILTAIPADCECYAVEKDPRLFGELMRAFPNTGLLLADFLLTEPAMFEGGRFDAILMNPPFEKGADIRHIEHALTMLKPGGTLVAICADGPRQEEALRWRSNTYHPIAAGTFAGTNVSTRLVVMIKPAERETVAPTLFDIGA